MEHIEIQEESYEAPVKTYLQVRKSDNRVVGYSTSGILENDDEFMAIEYEGEIDDNTIYFYEYSQKARTPLIFRQDWKDENLKKKRIKEETEKANQTLQNLMQRQILSTASDTDAYTMRYLYDEWKEGKTYIKDERIMYDDKFYRVLQNHTSQLNWKPNGASSLYVEISDPNEEYPKWKQPTGVHDSYNIGDKVTYQGKKYISKINANTTIPGSDPRWWELV